MFSFNDSNADSFGFFSRTISIHIHRIPIRMCVTFFFFLPCITPACIQRAWNRAQTHKKNRCNQRREYAFSRFCSVIFNFYYCIMILYVAFGEYILRCVRWKWNDVAKSDNVDSTPISSILSANFDLIIYPCYVVYCWIYCILLLICSIPFRRHLPFAIWYTAVC